MLILYQILSFFARVKRGWTRGESNPQGEVSWTFLCTNTRAHKNIISLLGYKKRDSEKGSKNYPIILTNVTYNDILCPSY